MRYWIFYLIGIAPVFHPHLKQKVGMLWDYFSHPAYEFRTTFSDMDFLDLLLHTLIPVVFFFLGIKNSAPDYLLKLGFVSVHSC